MLSWLAHPRSDACSRCQENSPVGSARPASVVSAPSLWTVPAEVRRAAGLRRMAKGFQGQLEVPSRRHPYASAEGTNLELV
jgi:hypothetical protein